MADAPPQGAAVPRFRIGAVSRATGLSPDIIRVWERRYGLLTPGRSEAGGRLYSEADIARLRLFKQLVGEGHAIGQLAPLTDEQLRKLVADGSGAAAPAEPSLAPLRERFLEAVLALDVEEAQRILGRASLTLRPAAFVGEFLAPSLQQIGDRWASGTLRVCHEHAASALMRTLLGALLANQSRPAASRTMIVTTPSGELHEFGALLVALLGANAGWRVIYLGPNLPAAEIAAAAEQSGAVVVALSMVNGLVAGRQAELARLAEALPRGVKVLLGGSAAAAHVKAVPGALLFEDLAACAAWLA